MSVAATHHAFWVYDAGRLRSHLAIVATELSITDLLKRFESLEAKVAEQQIVIERQAAIIERQAAEIARLRAQLARDSTNSSKPPSSDGLRRKPVNRSLREASGKKPGGQRGHRGSTADFSERPVDQRRHHRPGTCARCAEGLGAREHEVHSRHLVLDVPPVAAVVTEHLVYACRCASCGYRTVADRPAGVAKAPRSYGPRVAALATYLSDRHFVAAARVTEALAAMFGVRISTGTVDAMRRRAATRAAGAVSAIYDHVARAHVVGGDETAVRIEGANAYVWGFQTRWAGLLRVGPSRRADVLAEAFPDGLPRATYVTDRYAGQLKIVTGGKQFCVAHLMRTCKGLAAGSTDDYWPLALLEALSRIARAGALGSVASAEQHDGLRAELDYLLDEANAAQHGELSADAQSLRRSLRPAREHVLTCLLEADVPPDNNASERLLRNLKVKGKVSGGFRSEAGARVYCRVRSVIETAIRLGVDVLEAISNPDVLMPRLAVAE